MVLLKSALLVAHPHGFTTREGGASAGPFASLNLGEQVGDEPGAVAENWRRLEAATGLAFARARQVHGARVVRPARTGAPGEEGDVVIATEPGVAACVSVADCVPILIADARGGAVAAVHAGWRGTLALAAAEGVRALLDLGARPADLVAAIGPAIGPCCYEVSADLAGQFRSAFGPEVVTAGRAGPHLDLPAANAEALRCAGVERVDRLGPCTACEPERFFSHRRDAGRSGRMAAFIAPRPISREGPLP